MMVLRCGCAFQFSVMLLTSVANSYGHRTKSVHRLTPSTTVVVVSDLAAFSGTALIEEPFDEAVSTPMSVSKSRHKRSTFGTDFGSEIDPKSIKIGQFLELFEVKNLPDRPLEP